MPKLLIYSIYSNTGILLWIRRHVRDASIYNIYNQHLRGESGRIIMLPPKKDKQDSINHLGFIMVLFSPNKQDEKKMGYDSSSSFFVSALSFSFSINSWMACSQNFCFVTCQPISFCHAGRYLLICSASFSLILTWIDFLLVLITLLFIFRIIHKWIG